jgi:hypothetical protein
MAWSQRNGDRQIAHLPQDFGHQLQKYRPRNNTFRTFYAFPESLAQGLLQLSLHSSGVYSPFLPKSQQSLC